MEINIKTLAICVPILIMASFMVGRYTVPTKVITKVEEHVVTKEVDSSKDVKKIDVRSNKDEVVTETTKPDGTKIKETHYVDRTETITSDTKTDVKTDVTDSTRKSETITTNEKGNWNIAALAGVNSQDEIWKKQIGYGAIVQRKIIGPFYLGGWANGFGSSSQSYGVSLGGSF